MRFQRMPENFDPLPAKETPLSAGFDLRAQSDGEIFPGERKLVKCGWAIEIPPASVGMVCTRSGLALKQGIVVLNAPGIIDADYRGEIGVILANMNFANSGQPFEWAEGDRIAQLVVVTLKGLMDPREVNSLDDTERGDGGFGSTGVS